MCYKISNNNNKKQLKYICEKVKDQTIKEENNIKTKLRGKEKDINVYHFFPCFYWYLYTDIRTVKLQIFVCTNTYRPMNEHTKTHI